MVRPMAEPLIRAEALTKIVQSGDAPLTILDDVTFDVEAGADGRDRRRVGLGQDDAARACWPGSTVRRRARCASTATRCRRSTRTRARRCAQRLLGFVFQSFQLLPALTALENVMLPLELAGADDADGRARTWLARVGLAQARRRTIRGSCRAASSSASRSRARSPASRSC